MFSIDNVIIILLTDELWLEKRNNTVRFIDVPQKSDQHNLNLKLQSFPICNWHFIYKTVKFQPR